MAMTQQENTARAVLREYRMSATKARQVLAVIRNRSAMDAIRELSLINREASEVIGKLLASAVANASVRYGLSAGELYVKEAFADEGTTLKRFRPRARGRAGRIRKRSCHITVVVAEMSREMVRREALKSGGRSANRRAERVASSRRTQGELVTTGPTAIEQESSDIEATGLAEPQVNETEANEATANEVEATVVEASVVEATEIEPEEISGTDSDEEK